MSAFPIASESAWVNFRVSITVNNSLQTYMSLASTKWTMYDFDDFIQQFLIFNEASLW